MYEQAYYEKSFLREVICRIDFAASVERLRKSLPPSLAKEFLRDFPIAEPVNAVAEQLQLSGAQVRRSKEEFVEWRFHGKEREKKLVLTAGCVFITYSRYRAYEDMKAHFAAVTGSLARAFPDVSSRRFGLRYINAIDISDVPTPTSWDKYIAKGLLGTTAFFPDPSNLTRSIHIAELKYGNIGVRFQFGMPNPDHPAAITRPQYVLDLDAYVETAHDLPESLRYMDEAHGIVQDLFERSITDGLRERMDAKKRISIRE